MKFNTIDDLKAAGFEGFIPVAQLQTDSTAIPRTAGVYMVVYTGENIPEFLSRGTGGFFNTCNMKKSHYYDIAEYCGDKLY